MKISNCLSKIFVTFIVSICCISCADKGNLTAHERQLIHDSDSIMRVLTVSDTDDLDILRKQSSNLSGKALISEEFSQLSKLMISTVTHPSQDGVGIAGPQIGLNRRVIAVQRFDKGMVAQNGSMSWPFEVYANVDIVWKSDSLITGTEGCLSIPEMRGDVPRSSEIIIEYADINAIRDISPSVTSHNEIPMVQDTVKGFTAVIFQHEIDHLDGILYTDRMVKK